MASCSDGACTTLLIHTLFVSKCLSFFNLFFYLNNDKYLKINEVIVYITILLPLHGKTASTTHASTFGAISRLSEKDGQ
jgi:hypothetical protein